MKYPIALYALIYTLLALDIIIAAGGCYLAYVAIRYRRGAGALLALVRSLDRKERNHGSL